MSFAGVAAGLTTVPVRRSSPWTTQTHSTRHPRHRIVNCKASKTSSESDESGSPFNAFLEQAPAWPRFLGTLFATGSISGPLLDAIHSRTRLQVYDSLPIDIDALDFHSSLWVVPLLATFYVVLGALYPLFDIIFDGPDSKCLKDISWGSVGAALLSLVAALELSALLYENGFPYYQIHIALAITSFAVWKTFDGSKQGLILPVVCGVGALASEAVLLNIWGLWHYSRPDFLGLYPSWVIWCYIFYSPVLGRFARKLWIDGQES